MVDSWAGMAGRRNGSSRSEAVTGRAGLSRIREAGGGSFSAVCCHLDSEENFGNK